MPAGYHAVHPQFGPRRIGFEINTERFPYHNERLQFPGMFYDGCPPGLQNPPPAIRHHMQPHQFDFLMHHPPEIGQRPNAAANGGLIPHQPFGCAQQPPPPIHSAIRPFDGDPRLQLWSEMYRMHPPGPRPVSADPRFAYPPPSFPCSALVSNAPPPCPQSGVLIPSYHSSAPQSVAGNYLGALDSNAELLHRVNDGRQSSPDRLAHSGQTPSGSCNVMPCDRSGVNTVNESVGEEKAATTQSCSVVSSQEESTQIVASKPSGSTDVLQGILFNAGKICREAGQGRSERSQEKREGSVDRRRDKSADRTYDRQRENDRERWSRKSDDRSRRNELESDNFERNSDSKESSTGERKNFRRPLDKDDKRQNVSPPRKGSRSYCDRSPGSPRSRRERSGSSRSNSERRSPARYRSRSRSRDRDSRDRKSYRDSSSRQVDSRYDRTRRYDRNRRSPANRDSRSSSRPSLCNSRDRDSAGRSGRRQGRELEEQNCGKPPQDPSIESDITSTSAPTSDGHTAATANVSTDECLIEGEDGEIIIEEERIPDWIRCSPADLYFRRDKVTNILTSTKRMLELEKKFETELVRRAEKVRASKPLVVLPPRKSFVRHSRSPSCSSDGEESENESGSDSDNGEEQTWLDELNWRKIHPERLHEELWFNLPQEMNDGPLCRCSERNLQYGIRHNIYPGEKLMSKCDSATNNPDKLFHYRITMSPHTNFLTKSPTLIEHDCHEYIFEGFSLFSHYKFDKVPLCKVIRFNIEYTIHYFEEDMIENFDVQSLDLFADFLYREILELFDLDWAGKEYNETCRRFHIMPRFSRDLPDNGKEILSMNEVLNYMIRSSKMLCDQTELANLLALDERGWQKFVDEVRGMIVTYPGMRPCSLRIDQLDREQKDADVITFPKIVHFGVRPAQLSYAGDSTYQKLWKQYIRTKHLVANKPKVMLKDREKLRLLEDQLQDIRLKGSLKRETTVEISSEGFVRTGIKSDICQHALLLPVLIQHLLFHKCLDVLEEHISYTFEDRLQLQLALTHPSFRMNYGTNADHARNSLTNCGKRQLEYGDKRIHFIHTRKRGINTLMYIMSKMANTQETPSEIHHYERLEFLGDAVIEFLSSIHLFFMFPRLEEGGLATYRAALVQNQHLSVLAEKMGLQHFMLYAHGPDLCHDLNIRHALANCFEALMGALFLDGGIDVADRVFGEALFKDEEELLYVWKNVPLHPLQDDEPNGDRHWISQSPPLQNLVRFEESSGIVFNHIRLLARAFTMRNIGYNNLTLGHNQTLEFLGDTVLQLISSEYLFKHFPDHHEGHLTLLRSSLVNNRTQAIICDDLGMTQYVINNDQNVKERINNEHNKVKDKADIVEAFIGAMYVDQGLESCSVFCQVCFFPRLKEFIMNQDWNDAKSQLQQCCLTLRDTSVGEPDIPVYKVLQSIGPTNTRKYHVAVYFRGERLATGVGHSIQQAEMQTAANALKEKADLFPHLLHTKRFLDWRFGSMRDPNDAENGPPSIQPPMLGPGRSDGRRRNRRRNDRRNTEAILKNDNLPRSYSQADVPSSSPSKKRRPPPPRRNRDDTSSVTKPREGGKSSNRSKT